MRILVTGAHGNLGSHAVDACLEAGDEVTAVDLPRRRPPRRAPAGTVAVVAADLTDAAFGLEELVKGHDAVIHTAFMLWPESERRPDRARAVNVGGTNRLIAACASATPSPRLVFTSSIAVFGHTQSLDPPRRSSDPVSPVDVYSATKVECERLVAASDLDWVITRVGVATPIRPTAFSRESVEQLFRIRADNRMEFVHPADVGRALAVAARAEDVTGKLLLLGGGARNRIHALDLTNGMLGAMGLGALPADVFGGDEMYTDWLDTDESQRLLDFQRLSFEDYLADVRTAMRSTRMVVRPLAPILRPLMIRMFGCRDRQTIA